MKQKNKHIFVFGIFAVDLSFYVDKKVKPGETIIAKSSNIGPGGKASNQAISARKLGASTTLITRLGNDNFSSYANNICLLYTSPSPRDRQKSRMPSSA